MSINIIDGVRYLGNSVSIINGNVIIDGVVQGQTVPRHIEIRVVEGTLHNLTTDESVNCNNVTGDVTAGGSVNCDDVGGSVTAGGSVIRK